ARKRQFPLVLVLGLLLVACVLPVGGLAVVGVGYFLLLPRGPVPDHAPQVAAAKTVEPANTEPTKTEAPKAKPTNTEPTKTGSKKPVVPVTVIEDERNIPASKENRIDLSDLDETARLIKSRIVDLKRHQSNPIRLADELASANKDMAQFV